MIRSLQTASSDDYLFQIEILNIAFLGKKYFSLNKHLKIYTGAVWKLPRIVFRTRRDMHQVGFGRKREVFSMKEIHAERPFPCDYVRNAYCKHVITSTAEI